MQSLISFIGGWLVKKQATSQQIPSVWCCWLCWFGSCNPQGQCWGLFARGWLKMRGDLAILGNGRVKLGFRAQPSLINHANSYKSQPALHPASHPSPPPPCSPALGPDRGGLSREVGAGGSSGDIAVLELRAVGSARWDRQRGASSPARHRRDAFRAPPCYSHWFGAPVSPMGAPLPPPPRTLCGP